MFQILYIKWESKQSPPALQNWVIFHKIGYKLRKKISDNIYKAQVDESQNICIIFEFQKQKNSKSNLQRLSIS